MMDGAFGGPKPKWRDSIYSSGWRKHGTPVDIVSPGSGAVIDRVGSATAETVGEAAALAAQAQPGWAATSYDDRARLLRKAAALLEERIQDYAGIIMQESGAGIGTAMFGLTLSVRLMYEAAAMPSQSPGMVLPSSPGRISICRRQPLGVVGVISPFNAPFYLSLRAVAPALAIGNGVVLKPDPRTPVSGGMLIASLFEDAGLPRDVLHVLPGGGDVGAALCTDPNIAMIQFTGSSQTGRMIGKLAGEHLKKVSLELGGKNSLIILDDADLDLAASNAAFGAYLHQGQICMTAGRILVQSSIIEPFTEKLAVKARALGAAEGEYAFGPLIDQRQLAHADDIVRRTVDAGATLLVGGGTNGLVYPPTVLTGVTPDMPAFREEIFGPVAVLTPFATDEDAISLANDTEYGLSAGIMSRSVGRAMALGEKLRVGVLHINDQTVADDVINPFGGRGVSGNGTAIGGPANWDEFSQWQWVTIQETAPAYPF
jgi:benzaldehyde dehydrogenase (NAD)